MHASGMHPSVHTLEKLILQFTDTCKEPRTAKVLSKRKKKGFPSEISKLIVKLE